MYMYLLVPESRLDAAGSGRVSMLWVFNASGFGRLGIPAVVGLEERGPLVSLWVCVRCAGG